ncbi:MAG: L,D-transpeptidase [Eubacteriales bacterium]
MSDRVDPITEEKESEVCSQDLQEDAVEKEETQEVLKTDALAEIPADEIPDEDFLAEPAEDGTVTEEELLTAGAEAGAETETETAAESPSEAVSGEAPKESAAAEESSSLSKKLAAFSGMSLRKKIAVGCGAAACVLAVVYIGIAQTYRTKFIEGTSINGIDAGKKTVSEVEDEIEKTVENYSLKLSFRDNRTETIDGDAIDYQYVSDGGVQKLLDEQNIYTWIGGALFGSEKSYTVDEDTQFNEQKLVEGLSNLPEMKTENQVAPTDAYLLLDETTKRYNIVPETEGNVLNVEAVRAYAKSAVSGSVETVDLAQAADTYAAPAIRANDEGLNSQKAALNTFLSTSITYTLPEGTQVLDANVLDGWISVDDNGYRYVDEEHIAECVDQYVADLASAVDVEKETSTFASTNRGMVEVDNNEYVIKINQDAEKEKLLEEVLGNTVTQREPVYSRKDETQDPTFGGTYVEIDIDNQTVYYYEDGQCLVETPCVTGTGSVPRRSTPTGVFHIYDKQRSRTLYGDIQPDGSYGYASFVNYWMRFCGGCGLHDATWRDSFGGDIYWDSGSHGCVNLPYEAAAQMYEIVEEGTPCIVF